MQTERVTIPVPGDETISGALSIPDGYAGEPAVIFAHGAANDLDHPLLAYLAEGLAGAGVLCLRFNFLYREKGRESVDSLNALYSAWQSAYRFLSEHPEHKPECIFAAGKSLGGRIASQMAAEGLLPAEGLIFLGYPLHAPGRPDRIRDSHLYQIEAPMLFFAGTRDQFCELTLLEGVLSRLPAPWELEVIDGGDHSFNLPKSAATDQESVYTRILGTLTRWVQS